ncbi:MAG: hypothetical protein K2X87_16405 [Gemmataceae bacterium]|nr:hypothetical protein [Gemmataceae bacterium]
MPLAFVLDEHLRGDLGAAIRTHNQAGGLPIDAVCVGDPPDLPLGSKDPAILLWAEARGRIVVSRDFRTMPGHLLDHLAAGRRSPGVALLRPSAWITEVVAYLEVVAHAAEAYEFADAVRVIPEA